MGSTGGESIMYSIVYKNVWVCGVILFLLLLLLFLLTESLRGCSAIQSKGQSSSQYGEPLQTGEKKHIDVDVDVTALYALQK